MSVRADLTRDADGQPILYVGKAVTIRYYVTTGRAVKVRTVAENGASTIEVEDLDEAISSGEKVRFGAVVATLTADAVQGARSLAVSAIVGRLPRGSVGYKVVNVTGWTVEWVARDSANAAILSRTVGSGITLGADGLIEVAFTRALTLTAPSTVLIEPGVYPYALARTTAGSETPLAEGDIEIAQVASL